MKSMLPLNSPGLPRWARALVTTTAAALCAASAFSAPYSVDFEGVGETKTSYSSGSVSLSGIEWNITDALIGNLTGDFKNGTASARLRGYGTSSMTMLGDKAAGAGAISFSYRRYSTDSQQPWAIEYSQDTGSTWTQAGVDFTATESEQVFNETLNLSGNIRFRVICKGTGTSNRRMNIDDILVTDFSDPNAPPVISSLSPESGAIDVSISSSLVATFSKSIKSGTGDIILQKTLDSTPVAATITIAGSTLTIDPAADLDYETGYTVVVPPGAITDSSDNPFGGIPETATWTFTTIEQDLTAPLAVSFTPAPGSENIEIPAFLTITFDEAVQVPILAALVSVKDSGGNTVAQMDTSIFGGAAIISGASGNVATINLPAEADLQFGTSYYVEVAEGAFEDLAGNPFGGISGTTAWTFSTVDVPDLTAAPYTQDFSTYTSAASLPLGWSAKAGPGYLSGYEGDWGTISQGGFRGNASVFGYHHTSQSGTVFPSLEKILTLRNMTGAVITDLTVTYKGRSALPQNTRLPAYEVSVAGVSASGLSYTTLDPDNSQRNASVGGLSIAEGDTFQIKWVSNYPTGAGSARQIGISDVFVNAASSLFPPSVARLSIPSLTIAPTAATAQAEVLSDGGAEVTARGFAYSETSLNAAPVIGGSGVIFTTDAAPAVGAFSQLFTGLTAATSYSVSAYATSLSGTTYTSPVVFTTLATPPTFVSSYTQQFANYDGNNPSGWTALSDASPPVEAYVGAWGTTSSTGGFLGGNNTPGVLGYRHTGNTGNLTVTLRLINGTGAEITTLNVGYRGRVNDIEEGRYPQWAVSFQGSEPIAALAYSTEGNVDAPKFAELTGLSIAAGAEFTISWTSERGAGSGSSKQIGIADVYVGLEPPVLNNYANWALDNVEGQGSSLDFDGDGVPNGVEYFMGTAPNVFTATPGIVSGAVTWPRAPETTISSFKVEVSSNLSTWEDATVNYAANLSISASQVTFTMPAGSTKLFVRLNVVP